MLDIEEAIKKYGSCLQWIIKYNENDEKLFWELIDENARWWLTGVEDVPPSMLRRVFGVSPKVLRSYKKENNLSYDLHDKFQTWCIFKDIKIFDNVNDTLEEFKRYKENEYIIAQTNEEEYNSKYLKYKL